MAKPVLTRRESLRAIGVIGAGLVGITSGVIVVANKLTKKERKGLAQLSIITNRVLTTASDSLKLPPEHRNQYGIQTPSIRYGELRTGHTNGTVSSQFYNNALRYKGLVSVTDTNDGDFVLVAQSEVLKPLGRGFGPHIDNEEEVQCLPYSHDVQPGSRDAPSIYVCKYSHRVDGETITWHNGDDFDPKYEFCIPTEVAREFGQKTLDRIASLHERDISSR